MNTLRETVLSSMARTLFVTAYADACDEYDSEDSANERRHGSGYSPWTDAPRAGAGENWMDVAPDASEFDADAAIEARKLAERMLAECLRLNAPGDLATLVWEWCAPESQRYNDGRAHDAELFGHYLTMQSLGHGVGLNDDTAPGCRCWETGLFDGLSL